MLKHRLLTAVVLLPILLVIIWYLPMPWFSIFVGIVMAWAGWEWSGLLLLPQKEWRFVYTALVVAALVVAYFLPINWVLVVGFIAWLWAALAVFSYAAGRAPAGMQTLFLKALMGLLALVPCWLAISVCRSLGGPFWLFFGLLLIWAMDTGAYFSGRFWGKHKMMVRVSPKKTWEGFCGGMVLTLLVAVIVSLFQHASGYRILLVCILAFVTGLFAVLGDFVESMLKRQADVKDSGTLLPGHGGILDRIDSITAALPVFALGSLLLLGG